MGYAIRPLAVGEILDHAFALCRDCWRAIAVITVVLWVPTLLFPEARVTRDISGMAPQPFGELLAQAIGMIATTMLAAPYTAAMAVTLADAYLDRPTGFSRIAQRTLSVFPACLLANLISIACMIVGFAFLVLPALWFMLHFSLIDPVVAVEGCSARQALRRSYELVRDSRWRALCLLLVLAGLWIVVGRGASWMLQGVPAAAPVMLHLVSACGIAFANALFTIFYFDRVCRREAFDIEHLARQVDARNAASMVS